MVDTDPSMQLQQGLESPSGGTIDARRPILIHLNADTTWLLSLPYPHDALCPSPRCFFNILIDPWLRGSQTDIAAIFSTQWHAIKSSVQTIEELNNLLHNREDRALEGVERSHQTSSDSSTSIAGSGNYIDVVVCSHEFTDHCHQKTLEEIDPSVPCFAAAKAAERIRSWKHFHNVFTISPFAKGSDWRETSAVLPSWVGIRRMVAAGRTLLHSALAIIWRETTSKHPGAAECIVYTPHGVFAEDLAPITTADPPIQTLALLHGLHDVSIPFVQQLNLGAHNALKCQSTLRAKWLLPTHDEIKKGSGVIAAVLRRKVYTLDGALKAQENAEDAAKVAADDLNYVELASGQSLLLR